MINPILILGASGNFGGKIARSLARDNMPLIVAGRRESALCDLKQVIHAMNPLAIITLAVFDVRHELVSHLQRLKPFIVINTCGPFQGADYSIARACASQGIHYIDLADARGFVNGIHQALDPLAKKHKCLVVSGASTVPGLSSAVLDHYKNQFSVLDSLIYGITPGQKVDRGVATSQGVLSYVGKRLKPVAGSLTRRYGWQDLYKQSYPLLGKRWMANCDIPDLDLFPNTYGIRHMQFSAGFESHFLQLSLWLLSWLVRCGLPLHLDKHAQPLLQLSHWFDSFGSDAGGMHMIMSGLDLDGKPKTIKWFLIATHGAGPHIPTIPAIILTQKLVDQTLTDTGAVPCMNLISLEEYLAQLERESPLCFKVIVVET